MLFICTIAFFVHCLYWLYIFSITVKGKTSQIPSEDKKSISLIIAAHNEIQNLRQHIDHWLAQDVSEIIFGLDRCNDGSAEFLAEMRQKDQRINFCQIDKMEEGGKKRALAKAIEMSSGRNLLFTDTDCVPASNQWANLMVGALKEGKEIVIGYGPYHKTKTWLNKWVRFETYFTALQYFSWTKKGMPYMSVGRNFAYTRALFDKVGGFSQHSHVRSGDDDLFMAIAATSDNVAIQVDKNSFVYSKAVENWRALVQQKRRHLSTGKYYSQKVKIRLATFFLSHIIFYGSLICILFSHLFLIGIGALILRWILLYLWNKHNMKLLKEQDLYIFLPILDFALFLYYIFFSPFVFLKNTNKW